MYSNVTIVDYVNAIEHADVIHSILIVQTDTAHFICIGVSFRPICGVSSRVGKMVAAHVRY